MRLNLVSRLFGRRRELKGVLPEGQLASLRDMTDEELIFSHDYIATNGVSVDSSAEVRRLINQRRLKEAADAE